jgi:hypothetical protein
MPLPTTDQDGSSGPPMNCWLVRRQTQEGCEEYVARFEATALMIWDYMQHDILLHGPTPVKMVMVWRPQHGAERMIASVEIESKI